MSDPGEKAGDCPRCGGERIQIGHGTVTLGVYCPECDMAVMMTDVAVTNTEMRHWREYL